MVTDGRPNQYRGKLSPLEIAEGMNAAIRNAHRLAIDAKILLNARRFPSAASLAILAIEESGKVSILRGLSIAPTDELVGESWKDYRNHRAKNAQWIIMDLVARGASWAGDLKEIFEKDSDHPTVLDSAKQIGLYTDCYGERHWSEPAEIIDGDLAAKLLRIAEILCRDGEVTAREIELWIEHVGPFWGTPEISHAVVRFAAAMEREGLARHTAAEFEKFLFGPGALRSNDKPPH